MIPSPSTSMKIQIMGKKVCLALCKQTCENKKFVDITQQCFALLLKVKVMGSNPGYLLNFFLLYWWLEFERMFDYSEFVTILIFKYTLRVFHILVPGKNPSYAKHTLLETDSCTIWKYLLSPFYEIRLSNKDFNVQEGDLSQNLH